MQCPICDGLAEELPNTIDGKSIHCERCGDFDVSGSVYDTGLVERLDPTDRARALENAKRAAPQGQRPMITTHSLDKAVFVGSTLQEAKRKADDWWMRQKGVREVHRSKISGGFTGPSLRDADQFTVTIHYEPEK
jgi:hypothetical protein